MHFGLRRTNRKKVASIYKCFRRRTINTSNIAKHIFTNNLSFNLEKFVVIDVNKKDIRLNILKFLGTKKYLTVVK